MNIQVNNLDAGYTSCETLNNLAVTEGEKLITDLGTNITNLLSHWKGSDAAAHITNLITVYDALVGIVGTAKKVTSTAGSAMSAIQAVRRANGGDGNVGAELPNTAPESLTLTAPQATSEYYCDPSAKSDLTDLTTICTNFSSFKTKFETEKDALLGNWLAGANREAAKQAFDTFDENAESYEKFLTGAKNNLETAVSNITSLG